MKEGARIKTEPSTHRRLSQKSVDSYITSSFKIKIYALVDLPTPSNIRT
jgi:hypothetical protein